MPLGLFAGCTVEENNYIDIIVKIRDIPARSMMIPSTHSVVPLNLFG